MPEITQIKFPMGTRELEISKFRKIYEFTGQFHNQFHFTSAFKCCKWNSRFVFDTWYCQNCFLLKGYLKHSCSSFQCKVNDLGTRVLFTSWSVPALKLKVLGKDDDAINYFLAAFTYFVLCLSISLAVMSVHIFFTHPLIF